MRRLLEFSAAVLMFGSFTCIAGSAAVAAEPGQVVRVLAAKKHSASPHIIVPIHRSSPSQVRRPDQTTTGAVVPGFDSFSLPGNDDGSTPAVPLPFAFPYFGKTYTSVYINNNGNLTFGQPLGTYTPSALSQLTIPMIAPFWADVDTRVGNIVTYGSGTVNGQPAFGVNWPGVGCYSQIDSVTNNFQVLIIKTQTGFEIEFNYDSITWDSGQASGGNGQCLDGVSARAGYTSGKGNAYEIDGSGLDGAFLDTNSYGLIHRSLNSSIPGQYIFKVGNGIPAGSGYVALGDSYSSGEGTYNYNYTQSKPGDHCDRGAGAWPVQMSNMFPSLPRLNGGTGFFACAGATTNDLLNVQEPGEPASQLQSLRRWVSNNGTPGLVTVTIGGNNLRFADVLTACAGGVIDNGISCIEALGAVQAYLLTDNYTNTLAYTYQQIKNAANTGAVVAVGYPDFMPAPSFGNDFSVALNCPWLGDSTPVVLEQFQAIEQRMNADEEAAAAQAGILFASTAHALQDHEMCTSDSWINPIGSLPIHQDGHPIPRGQVAIAQAVAAQVGNYVVGGSNAPAAVHGLRRPGSSSTWIRSGRRAVKARKPGGRGGSRPEQSLTVQADVPANATAGSPSDGFLEADGGTEPYTWSILNGALPPGQSLDPSTGTISGAPATAGSYQFEVQATDASNPALTGTASVSVSVSNPAPLTVTTSTLPDPTQGIYYSATPSATGGIGPYTWSVSAGSPPAGLQIDPASGTISGTPTGSGSSSFTLTVTDSSPNGGITASQPITLNVTATGTIASITTTSLPGGTQGATYAGQLTATGGNAPVSWSVISGALPAGLTLDPATGVIGGVPTSAGTSTFTAQYTTGLSPNAQTTSSTFQIQVTAASPPVISTTQLPAATTGLPLLDPLMATGGVTPYTWSVKSGSLPPGLTLDPTQGLISGIPSATGTFSFVVKAKDSSTPTAHSVTQAETMTVNPGAPPPGMTLSDTVQDTFAGSPYAANIIASSGQPPYTFTISSGALPPGITLDAASGDLSGSATATGTYPFTVTGTDSTSPTPQTASLSLSITVAASQPLSITTTTLAQPAVGSPYAQQINVSGGVGADTFAVTSGTLPAGLTLDPATGIITGTPRSQTSAQFTVTVTDSATPTPNTASQAYTLNVAAVAPLTATDSGVTDAYQSSPYLLYLISAGGKPPITWSVASGSLPPGLTLHSSAGQISGTPTGSGSFTATIQASDTSSPAQTATDTVTINVAPTPPLTISTTSLGEATQGTAYSAQLDAAGGVPAYTWSISSGSLPAGLTLNASTGLISGTPAAAGYFAVTIQATDKAVPQNTATQSYLLPVVPSVLSLTGSLPAMTQGTRYKGALTLAGGVKPHAWTITAGSLPAGLHLAPSTGQITGTPTGSGPASFTLQVTDATQPTAQTASQAVSLTIAPAPPLQVTTTTLRSPTQGVAYSAKLAATGGVKPYSWQISSGALPAGLQLNATTGAISGTPTGSGTFSFTVEVTDSATPTAATATASLSLTVTASPLAIGAALPPATQGHAYTSTLAAVGGVSPYSWTITAGSLPAGLSLSASTGKVTGTPATTGQYSLTIQVTDSATPASQTAQLQFTLTVLPTAVQVLTSALPQAAQASSYSAALQAAGGVAPYTWAITAGSLPPGLNLNSATGAITGRPTATGTSQFTAQVTDTSQPNPQTSTVSLQITVTQTATTAPLSISAGPPDAIQGEKYSATLAAIGGTAPYHWAISSGTLPPGIKLAATTGHISGTPTQSGTFSFTIQATDSSTPTPQTATYAATVTVTGNTLTELTTALHQATKGTSYTATLTTGGGVPAYKWSIASGALPAGLTLATTGIISGTPAATGTFSITFNVTDRSMPASQTATSPTLELVVNPTP